MTALPLIQLAVPRRTIHKLDDIEVRLHTLDQRLFGMTVFADGVSEWIPYYHYTSKYGWRVVKRGRGIIARVAVYRRLRPNRSKHG